MANSQFDYEKIKKPGIFVYGKFSVLFMDIIRSTKYGDNQAVRNAVRALQNAITDIFEKVDWNSTSEVIPNGATMMPTGDGYGIGFEPSIVPDREILNYAATLSKRMMKEDFPVRIGISNGPCYIHQDLNQQMNLCGWGIIEAERTMSIGNENHILCERSFARPLLDQYHNPDLHYVGKYRAKHGRTLELYNYYSNEFGNRVKPKARKSQRREGRLTSTTSKARPVNSNRQANV